jgi:hypothetical protein
MIEVSATTFANCIMDDDGLMDNNGALEEAVCFTTLNRMNKWYNELFARG